jgi:hypothetical protein
VMIGWEEEEEDGIVDAVGGRVRVLPAPSKTAQTAFFKTAYSV